MDIFNLNPVAFTGFLLTLMRVSLLVFLLPFYGGDSLPNLVKASLCLIFTMTLWPHVAFDGSLFPTHPLALIIMLLSELVLGLMLGLCVHFIFAAVQTGGEILGFQMGFTMVTLADPLSGAQISITSYFLYMVSLFTFIALDGHLHLLRALADSFVLVPPGGLVVSGGLTITVLELSGGMFTLALKVAAPVMVAIFMVELTLALMARAAPQMNLLTLGFPIKIAVGFFFISLLFAILALRMEDVIVELGPMLRNLMRMGS